MLLIPFYFHSFIIFSIHSRKHSNKKHKLGLLEENLISILSPNIGLILCPFVVFQLAQFVFYLIGDLSLFTSVFDYSQIMLNSLKNGGA